MGYTTTMHIYRQYSRWTRVLLVTAVVLSFGFFISTSFGNDGEGGDQGSARERKQESFIPEKASTFGLSVSGVVSATDSVIVRAQTTGVASRVLVEEGSVVGTGEVLVTQQVPLIESRIALQDTQNGLVGLKQNASSIARGADRERTRIVDESASTSVILAEKDSQTKIENSTTLLAVQMYSSVTTLVSALNFIDEHESYFSSTNLRVFRETVQALYGGQRTYLTGTVVRHLDSHDDILAFLDSVANGELYLQSTDLMFIAERIDDELSAVREVLMNGESDFLDIRIMHTDNSSYTAYFTQREAVIDAQTNLRSSVGSVRVSQISGMVGNHSAETERELGRVNYMTASQMAENEDYIARQSDAVSQASLKVLHEESSLGTSGAPFAGVVSEVLVDEGAYLMQGEPLLRLTGTGGSELTVTVPHSMLPYLREGLEFTIDGVVHGYVTHFAPVLTGGSITVFIELVGDGYVVGDTLRGEIRCELTDATTMALPRAYVHFDTEGAYIRTDGGTVARVVILYDTGNTFIVRSPAQITEPLQRATGIIF